MSELQLKPDFENAAGAGPADWAAPADGSATVAAPGGASVRAARPRPEYRRLRLPSDDGFHLFRVY